MDWHFTVAGVLVGTAVGLTGVGGGALMTPLLVLLFGVVPTTAVGTDLLYAAATKTAATAVHGFSGSIDWRIVRRLALGSLPAAAATLYLIDHLNHADTVLLNRLVTQALGAVLVLTAVVMFRRDRIAAAGAALRRRLGRNPDGQVDDPAVGTVIAGAVLGVLVTATSVGGGALGVTFLFFLYPGLPASRIVGTDIAHAVPLTLIAGAGHFALGGVDLNMLGMLLLGSLPAVMVASRMSARLPDLPLRVLLSAIMAVVGIRLFFPG